LVKAYLSQSRRGAEKGEKKTKSVKAYLSRRRRGAEKNEIKKQKTKKRISRGGTRGRLPLKGFFPSENRPFVLTCAEAQGKTKQKNKTDFVL
jgi:hypothetical protein